MKIVKRIIRICSYIMLVFVLLVVLFFKTNLFSQYRDLWVQTAMTTSSHQFLATWFLSDEEINDILAKYEVINNDNSSGEGVAIASSKQSITVEEISGDTYIGYVVSISDPTSLSLINTVDGNNGTKLSEVVDETDAVVAMNAGGYSISRNGGILNSLMIINEELLYGDNESVYSMIGFSEEGILKLGNYTYQEAIDNGISDAIEFGPFLIVDGKNQITNESTGGLQPRSAIGQKADGTILFVVIEGRTSSSLGATLHDVQEIMNEYGAYNAANLDGGGSSALYYEGTLLNTLSNQKERALPNALIIT